jgi:IPT/TIG domain/Stigma-specific protein, Stig1
MNIVRSLLGLSLVAVLTSCSSSSDETATNVHDAGPGDAKNDTAGSCDAGSQFCNGQCVDLQNDAANCGACGTACASDELCCDSACVATAACSFSVTSLSTLTGWQNGGDFLTLTGAGFASGMKAFIGDGRAPVRVTGASSALIQTPPGTVGDYDVKVTLGGQSATLRKAFHYASGGLLTPWQEKPMATVRGEWPGVAVMQDARVLVAGGAVSPDEPDTSLDDAEIFDRASESVTPASSKMSSVRWRAAALTLLDGKVLVVGGACWDDMSACNGDATTADLFDPATGAFSAVPAPLQKPRVNAHAVLLPDGRAFVVSANDPSVEIYDPDAQTFALANPLGPHSTGFVVRLRDGRVLLGAGAEGNGNAAAEVYDPDSDTFTAVGSLQQGRYYPTAHTLPDGRVAVLGGASGSTSSWTPLDSIELFDPTTGTFSLAPYTLSVGRYGQGSALVRDGTIIAIGGYTVSNQCSSLTDSVDQIDPVKASVMPFAKLPHPNTELNAVTLMDGSIIAIGGGACGTSLALPDIDFLPADPKPR